ncbi:DNA adenine methylase [Methanosphaera sp. WGK6]|uniref:DNA adenine methylase n=1 Tax=Methanosphaera sp. WGK6 TaxID=1561964 RepID=UPI00084CDDB5|nr:DNA adenine methylase [Methanosphaera sp. WGK6]
MQVDLFNKKIIAAKPFMKWVGGKRQLIDIIESCLPEEILKSGEIKNYFEPFIGGGAVFFYLMSNYHVKKAYISDINKELILTYYVIKKDYETLIDYLRDIEKTFLKLNQNERKDFYLNIRTKFNMNLQTYDFNKYSEDTIVRASQTLFMNKTYESHVF